MSKKAILLMVVLVAAALFMALPVMPGTLPTSVVPEGVRWIAHLDMEKFVATKLYEYLEKDGRFELKNRDIDRWFKIDVPRDIAGLTVFGLGPGERQTVFVVAGKFDKARLLDLLALDEDHREFPYGAYTIYSYSYSESTGGGEFGAFINDGLIVFSESREAVEKVLDTAGSKAKDFASSKLSASLKDVPSGAFFSGVVEDLASLGKEVHESKFAEKARGMFLLAQEKGDDLQIRAQVTADSPESAKDMADLAQGLIALGRLSEGQGGMADVASLVDGIQITLDGKTVLLKFDGASREIADLLSHQHKRGGRGFLD